MIRKVSAEDIAIRGNGTGLEYMCPTRHFVYIFFNPVFQVSTAKNGINLFNNHILIEAPVTGWPRTLENRENRENDGKKFPAGKNQGI